MWQYAWIHNNNNNIYDYKTEKDYDIVDIDGTYERQSLSGSDVTQVKKFLSSGNSFTITFTTDASISKAGFYAKYRSGIIKHCIPYNY